MRAQQQAGKRLTLLLAPASKDSEKGRRAVKVVGEGFAPGHEYTIRCQRRTHDEFNNKLLATNLQEHTLVTNQAGRFEWADVPREGYNSSHAYYEYGVVTWSGEYPDDLYPSGRIGFNKQGRMTSNDTGGLEGRLKPLASWARIAMALGVMAIAYALLFWRGSVRPSRHQVEGTRNDFRAALHGAAVELTAFRVALTEAEAQLLAVRSDMRRQSAADAAAQCAALGPQAESCLRDAQRLHERWADLQAWWRACGVSMFDDMQVAALEVDRQVSERRLALRRAEARGTAAHFGHDQAEPRLAGGEQMEHDL
ncbi:MAG: hypothetical protein KKI08_21115 [Armatimonadetes bacterium]|nr:hypothetical protein [Armatimonadota bacterium]